MEMKKQKMSYVQRSVGILAAGTIALAGCSSSSSTPAATGTTVTNAGGAVSKAMSTISKSAPQVKPSSTVTFNWQPQFIRKPVQKLWSLLLPNSAFASTSSLSAIWGVGGALPLVSTQVSMINEFFGGTGTGVTQGNQFIATVTSANATAGAVYSNLSHNYTVVNTISGGTTLVLTPVSGGTPGPNGTFTKVSGTGDSTITFSAQSSSVTFTCDNTAGYCPSPGSTYYAAESLVDYVGQELSPVFFNTNGSSVTLFGRFHSALGIPCAIGNLITTNLDTDGLPSAGTYTVTFPSDTTNVVYQSPNNGGCGLQTNMAGMSAPAVFTAVTGSSLYTKKMVINVGNINTIYLKLDLTNGLFNMMAVESQIPGGRYAADRSILRMTGLNTPNGSKIGFEYVSIGSNCTPGTASGNTIGNCGTQNGDGTGSPVPSGYTSGNWQVGFELHRIYLDQANDVGYLFSAKGSPGNNSGVVNGTSEGSLAVLTAAGKPNEIGACSSGTCSQDIALSFGFIGQHDGAGGTSIGQAANAAANTTDYNGCVNVGTIAVDTDNTLTSCGLAGTNASSAAAALNTIRAHFGADAITNLANGSTASVGLSFTDGSDIYTATYQ